MRRGTTTSHPRASVTIALTALAFGCGQGPEAPPAPPVAAAPPAATGQGIDSRWDGRAPYRCSGRTNTTLTGLTVTLAAGPAIVATDECILRLVRMNVTAPVVIEASGSAIVTVEGGRIAGTSRSIVARDRARVIIAEATVEGPTENFGEAAVTGAGSTELGEEPRSHARAPTAPPTRTEPAVEEGNLLFAALCCHVDTMRMCRRGPLKRPGMACAIAAQRPPCAECATRWSKHGFRGDALSSLTRACPMCR